MDVPWRGIHRGHDGFVSWLHIIGRELAALVVQPHEFIATNDNAERANLMKQYQKVATTNLDTVGLTEYPGALIINKRFANVPTGAPIFMFNWAEDNIIRERVFVPADAQGDYELHPEMLPGEPGRNAGEGKCQEDPGPHGAAGARGAGMRTCIRRTPRSSRYMVAS